MVYSMFHILLSTAYEVKFQEWSNFDGVKWCCFGDIKKLAGNFIWFTDSLITLFFLQTLRDLTLNTLRQLPQQQQQQQQQQHQLPH